MLNNNQMLKFRILKHAIVNRQRAQHQNKDELIQN